MTTSGGTPLPVNHVIAARGPFTEAIIITGTSLPCNRATWCGPGGATLTLHLYLHDGGRDVPPSAPGVLPVAASYSASVQGANAMVVYAPVGGDCYYPDLAVAASGSVTLEHLDPAAGSFDVQFNPGLQLTSALHVTGTFSDVAVCGPAPSFVP